MNVDLAIIVLVEELENTFKFLFGEGLAIFTETPLSLRAAKISVPRVAVKQLHEVTDTVDTTFTNNDADFAEDLIWGFSLQ